MNHQRRVLIDGLFVLPWGTDLSWITWLLFISNWITLWAKVRGFGFSRWLVRIKVLHVELLLKVLDNDICDFRWVRLSDRVLPVGTIVLREDYIFLKFLILCLLYSLKVLLNTSISWEWRLLSSLPRLISDIDILFNIRVSTFILSI